MEASLLLGRRALLCRLLERRNEAVDEFVRGRPGAELAAGALGDGLDVAARSVFPQPDAYPTAIYGGSALSSARRPERSLSPEKPSSARMSSSSGKSSPASRRRSAARRIGRSRVAQVGWIASPMPGAYPPRTPRSGGRLTGADDGLLEALAGGAARVQHNESRSHVTRPARSARRSPKRRALGI